MAVAALFSIFRTRRGEWTGCTPPSAAERMALYSPRHAAEIQARENAGTAAPRFTLHNGRPVLVAFPTRLNPVPKEKTNVRT
ncbi:hypothetical protein DyAD56_16045 [Dyella sp. AD56]|nr:hypothetical protein DyAD56_16045 [Dyella sp. AD56]